MLTGEYELWKKSKGKERSKRHLSKERNVTNPHPFLFSSPSILRLAGFQDDKYDTRGFKLNFEQVKILWYCRRRDNVRPLSVKNVVY